MEHLRTAAPWLMAAAAIVSAVACIAAWRAVPWQGRQTALIMAVTHGDAVAGLILGAVLLTSAMLGTAGVRGTTAAATCRHRALVSLVMAICSFESAATSTTRASSVVSEVVVAGHGEHGVNGVLSVLTIVGSAGVIGWTVVSEWFVAPLHRDRTARLLTTESWAMAIGVAVMCLGF